MAPNNWVVFRGLLIMDTAYVDQEAYDAIQLEGGEMASVPPRTELTQYPDPVSELLPGDHGPVSQQYKHMLSLASSVVIILIKRSLRLIIIME